MDLWCRLFLRGVILCLLCGNISSESVKGAESVKLDQSKREDDQFGSNENLIGITEKQHGGPEAVKSEKDIKADDMKGSVNPEENESSLFVQPVIKSDRSMLERLKRDVDGSLTQNSTGKTTQKPIPSDKAKEVPPNSDDKDDDDDDDDDNDDDDEDEDDDDNEEDDDMPKRPKRDINDPVNLAESGSFDEAGDNDDIDDGSDLEVLPKRSKRNVDDVENLGVSENSDDNANDDSDLEETFEEIKRLKRAVEGPAAGNSDSDDEDDEEDDGYSDEKDIEDAETYHTRSKRSIADEEDDSDNDMEDDNDPESFHNRLRRLQRSISHPITESLGSHISYDEDDDSDRLSRLKQSNDVLDFPAKSEDDDVSLLSKHDIVKRSVDSLSAYRMEEDDNDESGDELRRKREVLEELGDFMTATKSPLSEEQITSTLEHSEREPEDLINGRKISKGQTNMKGKEEKQDFTIPVKTSREKENDKNMFRKSIDALEKSVKRDHIISKRSLVDDDDDDDDRVDEEEDDNESELIRPKRSIVDELEDDEENESEASDEIPDFHINRLKRSINSDDDDDDEEEVDDEEENDSGAPDQIPDSYFNRPKRSRADDVDLVDSGGSNQSPDFHLNRPKRSIVTDDDDDDEDEENDNEASYQVSNFNINRPKRSRVAVNDDDDVDEENGNEASDEVSNSNSNRSKRSIVDDDDDEEENINEVYDRLSNYNIKRPKKSIDDDDVDEENGNEVSNNNNNRSKRSIVDDDDDEEEENINEVSDPVSNFNIKRPKRSIGDDDDDVDEENDKEASDQVSNSNINRSKRSIVDDDDYDVDGENIIEASDQVSNSKRPKRSILDDDEEEEENDSEEPDQASDSNISRLKRSMDDDDDEVSDVENDSEAFNQKPDFYLNRSKKSITDDDEVDDDEENDSEAFNQNPDFNLNRPKRSIGNGDDNDDSQHYNINPIRSTRDADILRNSVIPLISEDDDDIEEEDDDANTEEGRGTRKRREIDTGEEEKAEEQDSTRSEATDDDQPDITKRSSQSSEDHAEDHAHMFSTDIHNSSAADLYCHDNKTWFDKAFILRSSPDSEGGEWYLGEVDTMIITENRMGRLPCMRIDFIGDVAVELTGWRIRGAYLQGLGGFVTQYKVSYMALNRQWHTFRDGDNPKIFHVNTDLSRTSKYAEYKLKIPVYTRAMIVCPQKTEGEHPMMGVDVYGCVLKEHTEFDKLQFSENYRGKHTCRTPKKWLGKTGLKSLQLYSNVGTTGKLVTFDDVGFDFPKMNSARYDNNTRDFLEVRFTGLWDIFQLKVSGNRLGSRYGMITHFTLKYKDVYNHSNWTWLRRNTGQIVILNTQQPHSILAVRRSVIFTFPISIVTTAIRLYPQQWWGNRPFLRLDLNFCKVFPFNDYTDMCHKVYNILPPAEIRSSKLKVHLNQLEGLLDGKGGYFPTLPTDEKVLKDNQAGLKIHFLDGMSRIVTSIIMKGGTDVNGKKGLVTQYQVQYVKDEETLLWIQDAEGNNATFYTVKPGSLLMGKENFNMEQEFISVLPHPIVTRHLMIHPTAWINSPVLRVELRGCIEGDDSPSRRRHQGKHHMGKKTNKDADNKDDGQSEEEDNIKSSVED